MKELITYEWSATLFYNDLEVFSFSNSFDDFKEFKDAVIGFFENVNLGKQYYREDYSIDFLQYDKTLQANLYYTFIDDLFESEAVLMLTFRKIYDNVESVKDIEKENNKFIDWFNNFDLKDIKKKQDEFNNYFVFDEQTKGYIKTIKINHYYSYTNFFKNVYIDNRFSFQKFNLTSFLNS